LCSPDILGSVIDLNNLVLIQFFVTKANSVKLFVIELIFISGIRLIQQARKEVSWKMGRKF
jgi:hypothetical protein